MTNFLHLDFETVATASLDKEDSVGIHNYWLHAETRPLMLAYAYGDEPVKLWQCHLGEMPEDLREGLEDDTQPLAAWNSGYERYGLKFKLGIDTKLDRWHDPQASARYLSLPGALDKVGTILALAPEFQKDAHGEDLIDLFCKPHLTRKKKGQEQREYFNDWTTHPKEWQEFCDYCIRDIVAEREIMRKEILLKVFPLPELERKIWIFDQKVNDCGMPTSVEFVTKMYELGSRSKKEAIEKQNQLTGLENANSNKQLLEWAHTQGYEPNTLNKNTVESELKYHRDTMTPLCLEVLEARRAASSTTYKKLSAILRQVSPDGRLRGQFLYMGSARCGRWSGAGVQLHNLSRSGMLGNHNFEDEKVIDDARRMIYENDYDRLKVKYGSVLAVVKNLIRTVFEASKNQQLSVVDLASIETRVSAWISGCIPLMEVFRLNRDAYLDFAVKMTGIQYEVLERDIKSDDKDKKSAAKRHRQVAKPGVLGCVYQLGGGDWGVNKYGDQVKKGLWGYSEAMGVEMTRDQAHEIVRIFRESYREIPEMWYALEKAVTDVLEGTRIKRELGPDGCVKIDKLILAQNDVKRCVLRIQLPSGRFLHYMDAQMDEVKMPWLDQDGKEVYRETLIYSGLDQETKVWKMGITSRGGKVFENIVQAIARDILAEKMLQFEQIGIPICGHVHDEAIGETPDCPFSPGVADMIEVMSQPVSWAPSLLLGADGFSGPYYHK